MSVEPLVVGKGSANRSRRPAYTASPYREPSAESSCRALRLTGLIGSVEHFADIGLEDIASPREGPFAIFSRSTG